METLLANGYTRLDQNSKLYETSSIATRTRELLQRKIYIKKSHFFLENGIVKSLQIE